MPGHSLYSRCREICSEFSSFWASLYFCRLCMAKRVSVANTESSGFVYYLNLLKMRFISWDLWGLIGEWLLGQGRLWGTEARDLLEGSAWGCALVCCCCWPWAGAEWQRWEFGNFLVKAEKLEAIFLALLTGESQALWPGPLPWNLLALLCEIAYFVSVFSMVHWEWDTVCLTIVSLKNHRKPFWVSKMNYTIKLQDLGPGSHLL